MNERSLADAWSGYNPIDVIAVFFWPDLAYEYLVREGPHGLTRGIFFDKPAAFYMTPHSLNLLLRPLREGLDFGLILKTHCKSSRKE